MAGSGTGIMRQIWPLFFLILLLHCVAILFFTRGFLLTRTELPYFSHCSDISQSSCFSSSEDPSSTTSNLNQTDRDQRCWTKPAINRLVIIVLDALRIDFVAPSTFFEEKKPWMDKLQVLQKMAATRGSSARIFKAIADPPTTSLQRLKGLTTGGLPTFIDVGNSFGAPAIVEDNLIHQFVQNGKRVVMMGDDTWVQLFPHHFERSYPFPSFNVKDLDTVDNGCIEHLLPSLYQDDWDVLIAHFLGVDHAGHIFGVDSAPMIGKLEQYDGILEKVIEELEGQSGPGGLHENTFLIVMGDHGQTLNGDHGGGTAEEVETSIFAMSFKKLSMPSQLGTSHELDLDKKNMLISSIQQLDFSVTMSALLGIPFPFGSIGRVNPELYALASGAWIPENIDMENCQKQSYVEEWMRNYVNVLCVNSWQVKRYVDVYSTSSVIGFSSEDLLHVAEMYTQAEDNWSHTVKKMLLNKDESCHTLLPALKWQIDAYHNFLASVAELARSKWTEFNLKMMGIGFCIMVASLFVHLLAIKRVNELHMISFPSPAVSGISIGFIFALFVVMIRAFSFLSNSYILKEGKVANFLLATTGILILRNSIMKKKMLLEALVFLLLVIIIGFTLEIGLSKQAATSAFMSVDPSWFLGIAKDHLISMYMTESFPILALALLLYLLYKSIASSSSWGILKFVVTATILNHMLIALHWALDGDLLTMPIVLEGVGKNGVPRIIYGVGIGLLLLLALGQLVSEGKTLDCRRSLVMKTVAMLSVWSSTVIILLGKQGPLVALLSIVGGWCIMRFGDLEKDAKDGAIGNLAFYTLPITQWSLFAVCLFFCTGHWCAFDGLRYGAAFIGFDEFLLIPQAILLTIDTFGFSHILPIFGLSFLVARQYLFRSTNKSKWFLLLQLSQVYLIYGLITAITFTVTLICVTVHRRHLMVWGLFAPKFVFDVVGLVLTDILICFASLYYFCRVEDDTITM